MLIVGVCIVVEQAEAAAFVFFLFLCDGDRVLRSTASRVALILTSIDC